MLSPDAGVAPVGCQNEPTGDPGRAQADGRQVRQRPGQDPSRAARRAGPLGQRLPRHVAPPAAGPVTGAPGPRRAGRAVRPARRLHRRARQRGHQRVLGRGRVRAGPRARPAPELRRVLGEVRRRHRPGPVAVRADRGPGRSRQPPGAVAGARGGCLRADPQRDFDRGGDAGAPRAGRRPGSTDPGRRDQRRGRRCRYTPASSTSTTSPRRRALAPTAGCGSR